MNFRFVNWYRHPLLRSRPDSSGRGDRLNRVQRFDQGCFDGCRSGCTARLNSHPVDTPLMTPPPAGGFVIFPLSRGDFLLPAIKIPEVRQST